MILDNKTCMRFKIVTTNNTNGNYKMVQTIFMSYAGNQRCE